VLEHGGTLSGLLMAQLEKVNGRQVLDPVEKDLSYLHALIKHPSAWPLTYSCPLPCCILLNHYCLEQHACHVYSNTLLKGIVEKTQNIIAT